MFGGLGLIIWVNVRVSNLSVANQGGCGGPQPFSEIYSPNKIRCSIILGCK